MKGRQGKARDERANQRASEEDDRFARLKILPIESTWIGIIPEDKIELLLLFHASRNGMSATNRIFQCQLMMNTLARRPLS